MAGRAQLLYSSSSIPHRFSSLSPLYSAAFTLHNHASRRIYIHQISTPQRANMFCTCRDTNSDPFVITTPLYYVNAPPHMGSAYTTIAADAVARFQRLQRKKVIFITGTDEHGEKIATAAAASGARPSDHCDAISQSYKALWKNLDIAYDRFIRTTDPQHEVIVKEFYSRVVAKGDIYRADYEGLYCINCEEYKDEKELIKDNCCPVHLKPCIARKEDNYFFALSKYQKKLEEILRINPEFVQPASRLNEVRGWVNSGLRDFSISRATVDWGIPVPNDDKQTIYVWFDALLGYISALSEGTTHPSLDTMVSNGWPASLHLIGKDILRFHAVYWPAMLLSAGLSLPKTVFGHGFLTKDGMKMGKSLGNTIEPDDLVQSFGSDAVRYFFLKEVELGNDGDYSEDRFIYSVNAGLANTIGNLLNRTLGLLKKNCESTLSMDSSVAAEGNPLKETVEDLVDKARDSYESLSLSAACEALLEIANAGNLYMNTRTPWTGFKAGGDAAEAAAKDLVIILEIMRILAITLSPVTPGLSLKIYTQLGFTEDQFKTTTWEESKWGGLKGGQVMSQPEPVFARIDKKTEGEIPEVSKKISQKKTVKKTDNKTQTQPAAAEA